MHKTNELAAEGLDCAVAIAEGHFVERDRGGIYVRGRDGYVVGWIKWPANVEKYEVKTEGTYQPSRDWKDGGSIIERERIAVWRGKGRWLAIHPSSFPKGYDGDLDYIDVESGDCHSGPTPLIAAMRAFVVSKLGGGVELPA